MDLEALAFREALATFVTGVTVVTAFDAGGRPNGITVNALASVSLEPPLVTIALARHRFMTPIVRMNGRFAVNVLAEGQQALADCFAGAPVTPGRDQFCAAAWHHGATGLPLLDGAIAALECTTREVIEAGDHDLFLAEVDAATTALDGDAPLLYFRRRYLRIERARALEVEGKAES